MIVGQTLKKKQEIRKAKLLSSNNSKHYIPRIVVQTQREQEKEIIYQIVIAPIASTTKREHLSAHMDSIIIRWNFTKTKVGNKENIPLIWGLPHAGCEGNLEGPLLISSRYDHPIEHNQMCFSSRVTWLKEGTILVVRE